MINSRVDFRFIDNPGELLVPRGWRAHQSGHRGLPMFFQQCIAFVILLVLSPLLLLIFLAIRLESQGGAIYKQVRVGKHGEHFGFYKLRTMYTENDPNYVAPDASESSRDGICLKFKKDPRITGLGYYLRRYSLDELPQLWNVVCGQMALVGPRPALTTEVAQYALSDMARLKVLPGITGLWQVSGRADIAFDQQLELDKRYIAEQSPFQDILILLRTIPAVISAKGAY
ncbi:sugar transferase [Pseudoteredinibacter isoporae]|uniref:Lipopolysaccharide/colanic/teichoic acid biosynthesis glycosyltransferase n=1 Tax=Pseudoteredinibacter isoporae TaxID=570281 RepID=A0A7X0JVQ4_9GAMM|nr:sugar transferase [Pseudoteredinibacter isoporae]MBB6523072.1 lipopolysaccharide/colanic/teichoic acid biosynthesis glycosyltransferase [Pseudoteredinibacter isoporae]NHO88592.1 sugar transferase [Pseudoteredinibacter isoporae]NIB22717.1 sugar transferase [Pseudoteredinibacter isoporae]